MTGSLIDIQRMSVLTGAPTPFLLVESSSEEIESAHSKRRFADFVAIWRTSGTTLSEATTTRPSII
jgi:hypothetical protein